MFKFWYTECLICKNLDPVWEFCNIALWKPSSIDGICKHYKEL
jgi:hypothetical protein